LTFATVIGEFTLASLLAWPAFAPYMALLQTSRAYEPAALAILSFALTWGAMGLIQWLGSGRQGQQSQLTGTH
jgi:putative spermidine/putrescine transport system permease protein